MGEIVYVAPGLVFHRQGEFQWSRLQSSQPQRFDGRVQPRHSSQQHRTVSPQTHLPGQSQTVEKHLAQT